MDFVDDHRAQGVVVRHDGNIYVRYELVLPMGTLTSPLWYVQTDDYWREPELQLVCGERCAVLERELEALYARRVAEASGLYVV